MSLRPNAEHRDLAKVLRAFFATSAPIAFAREALDGRGDGMLLWKCELDELGLVGLAIPEELGGQGFGLAELVTTCTEAGRALAGGPFFGTVCLSANLVSSFDNAVARRTLAAIAAGATVAAALREPGREAEATAVSMRAEDLDGQVRLTGTKVDVLGAADADQLLVLARADHNRIGLYSLDVLSPGVSVMATPAFDASRLMSDVHLAGATAVLVGDGERVETGLDRARVCLAAEAIGAADRCLERTIAHISTRVQFGRPVGAFQALQHRCVDVMVDIELARQGVRYATSVLTGAAGDPALATSLALAASLDAFTRAAGEEIQLHGGMGVAWESDAHLYFRRSVVSESLLGTPAWHRQRIAKRVATFAPPQHSGSPK